MSDTQTIWMVIWNRATAPPGHGEPFEIAEIATEVAERLKVSEQDATRRIAGLLDELERLPDGRQYFRREGNAIVALPEAANIPLDLPDELKAYPYEL
jgi:hypothetical protein